jgi:hypothetical protein
LADEASAKLGDLFGDGDGLWNEAGPWPETYRVGLKIPSLPRNGQPSGSSGAIPTPLFVNLVVSVTIDPDLFESESREWAKVDNETRISRERDRQGRADRKQRAKERAIADAEVCLHACALVCSGVLCVVSAG